MLNKLKLWKMLVHNFSYTFAWKTYALGHEGAAVLLPGFAINW